MKKLITTITSTMIISFAIILPKPDQYFFLYLSIFILLMMPFLYYYYLDKKKEYLFFRIKKERSNIIKNGDYKYIINYVKEYKWEIDQIDLRQGYFQKNKFNDCVDNKSMHRYVDTLDDLSLLMQKKGYKFKIGELLWLINEEVRRQEYIKFEKKILYNNPRKFQDYAKNFLLFYKLNQNNISYFIKLLKRKKIPYTKSKIGPALKKINRDIYLKDFEKHLNPQNKTKLRDFIN